VKLAIIGCGSIGMRHLKNALALGCDVFVDDTDVNRVSAALDLGATSYFVPTQLDALMVCTPYDVHLQWAQWAIERRMPLFVEKPLGSLDQIEDWRRLVEQSKGLVTQVGYQCRFHPMALAIASIRPQSGSVEAMCDMSKWPGSARYGSPILEMSHEIDLACWWTGFSRVSRLDQPKRRQQSVVFTLADESDSDDFGVELWWKSQRYDRTWGGESWRSGHAKVYASFSSPEELGDQMYVDELKHFLECVQSGRQTDVPLSDGLRVLEVCKQVEEMARQIA
jgi:predicted dehydrogenase